MRRAGGWVGAVLLAFAATAPSARGQSADPGGAERTEYALVPLAGGDTDIGFGVGALGSAARVAPGVRPFVWQVEGTAFISFKKVGGSYTSPYQDFFARLTITNLLGGRARLELRPSFTHETNLRYHGLGNAAQAPEEEIAARDFYTRTHPAIVARGRLALGGPFHVQVGFLYVLNWIDFEPVSNLARDLAQGSPRVKELLNVDEVHALNLLEAAIVLDTRDDEIAPQTGQFHTFKARVSPWDASFMPYRYAQLDLALRAYASPLGPRLVLAGRLVGDLLLGEVPFYELSRYDEASAIGGANGVRGVPADRYYGKRKLFGNLEARVRFVDFVAWDSRYSLGAVGFIDGGRVWADVTAAPDLDGTGLGLKYGVGGGLRLRKGDTFVLRTDLAWSPDARPIGFYFLAGQIF